MPVVQVTKEQLAKLVAAGLVTVPGNQGKGKRKGSELVAPAHPSPGVWVVPVRTISEKNARGWRTKSGRTHAARKAVSVAFGKTLRDVVPYAESYHQGRGVRVTLTRLGGVSLDPHDNLPVTLSGVLDAVCLLLGAEDDATAPLAVTYRQEPGGPMGVKIELFAEGV